MDIRENLAQISEELRNELAQTNAMPPLEALRGELTTAQWATKHGIHHTMVSDWKRQAMEGLTAVFADRSAAQA